jgi:uncharacterized UPF0160 family protein
MTTTTTPPEAQTAAGAVKSILTHPGVFHADDAMAVAILQHLLRGNALVIRSAHPADIGQADFVIDVGGVYDPATERFDHHQIGAPNRPDGSPYAAAGMVWEDKGRLVVLALLTHDQLLAIDSDMIRDIAAAVDRTLIRHIDAADNGVRVDGFTISQMVAGLNPTWSEPQGPDDMDRAFACAVDACRRILVREVQRHTASALAARYVHDAWMESPRDAYPGILLLERYLPWQDVVADIPGVKLVVYPSLRGGWNIQVVENWAPDGTKMVRCPLPESWYGLTDATLEEASGIGGATFCHKGGFLASHGDRKPDGALAMADTAILAYRPVGELLRANLVS